VPAAPLRSLVDADASCGGKARALARLIAAGLPVPDGFVIDARAFRELAQLDATTARDPSATARDASTAARDATAGPPIGAPDATLADGLGHALGAAEHRLAHGELPAAWLDEVRARAAPLGRLAVRSSASIEDGALGAAAGVFASQTDVAPADVWRAVRAVWTSALSPLAVAYARRRDAAIAIAVIVQRHVPGARVTVYTRPVGAPDGDELWIQRGEQLERVARDADRPEARLAIDAEAAIDAPGGADVELILGDAAWVVQARPIVHPVRAARRPPPAILLAPLVRDGRRWTWDVTHNPDPLSPAQAGLVDAVARAGDTPYELAVCAGYLYTARRAAPIADAPTADALTTPAIAPPRDRAELAHRIAAIEARFRLDADDLAGAIAQYVAFNALWATALSPLVAAARQVLLDRLAAPPEDGAARAAQLIGPRRVLRDPVMSPAWDVAVPTFAERAQAPTPPPPLPPAPPPPPELATEVELARAAADAAELDDLWFARAQWLVRRALLRRAAELGLRDDDVFWLPLDELSRPLDPEDAHRRASAARAAHARAAQWDMPLVIHGDAPPDAPAATLRGVGFGPRVIGRAVHFASLHAAPTIAPGDVVVTRAITPALAMLVQGCAALVSETGGLLDHGAALARELGIPCVVGCAGAWSQLSAGTLILVDGDAGLVSPAEETSTRTTTPP
jgi:pyruvate,water dikinase